MLIGDKCNYWIYNLKNRSNVEYHVGREISSLSVGGNNHYNKNRTPDINQPEYTTLTNH